MENIDCAKIFPELDEYYQEKMCEIINAYDSWANNDEADNPETALDWIATAYPIAIMQQISEMHGKEEAKRMLAIAQGDE